MDDAARLICDQFCEGPGHGHHFILASGATAMYSFRPARRRASSHMPLSARNQFVDSSNGFFSCTHETNVYGRCIHHAIVAGPVPLSLFPADVRHRPDAVSRIDGKPGGFLGLRP
jgi:hypothetical protein